MLWLLLFLFGCGEQKETVITETGPVDSLMNVASDGQRPLQQRVEAAHKAYELSVAKSEKRKIWGAFASTYGLLRQQDPEKAAAFLKDYIKMSSRRRDTLNLANGFYEKAMFHYQAGTSDSAFYFFNRSRQQYQLLRDSLQVAEKLLYMTDIYWDSNDYVGMEDATTEAIKLLGRAKMTSTDSAYTVVAYNNYGLSYTGLLDYDAALKSYTRAGRYVADRSMLPTIESNKAWVYLEAAEYTKAIEILTPLIGLPVKDSAVSARIYDNFGFALMKSGRTGALEWLQKGLLFRRNIDDRTGLVASLLHLGEYYGKNEQGMAFLREAHAIAVANKSASDQLAVLNQLRQQSAGRQRLYYSDRYSDLLDSVSSARQRARNQFARIRYDAAMEREHNLTLRADNIAARLELEQERTQTLIWIAAFLISAVAGAGIAIYQRNRSRYRQLRLVYETETNISRRLHDEIANDTYKLLTMAGIQDLSDPVQKEALLSQLEGVYQGVRDISRENAEIETGDAFGESLKDMMSGYNDNHCRVLFKGFDNIEWNHLTPQAKITVYRVILELLVNMRKHSGCAVALLQFSSQGRKITVDYADDGRGAGTQQDFKKNGLRNVENRIKAIKGTVTFENPDKGFRMSFSFPI